VTDPPEAGLTLPTPLSIEALVALLLDQLSVEVFPCVIEAGLAENDPDGGATTVTVVCCVVVPPAELVSVSVYVVVADGDTLTDPPETGVTDPTPLLIEALVAPLLDQVSVVLLPDVIVAGLAVSVPAGAAITVTVTCCVVVPPGPVKVKV
jgi:hypothetical protein